MHHKTREAAITKMKKADPDISDAALEATLELMEKVASPNADLDPESVTRPAANAPQSPMVVMKRYDIWRGEFALSSPKTIPGTGQTIFRRVQFQFTDPKPKKSVSVTEKDAELWNSTRFTARKQATELLFPAGKKLDYWWIYNEETEKHEFVAKELEIA